MVGLGVLLAAAVIDIRIWLRLAYPIYGAVLVLLIAVEIGGTIGMGARRWIDLGLIQIQPSELMKVALVLVLARYFHAANPNDRGWLGYLLPPLVLLAAPVLLVSRQPDLGTAMILLMVGVSVFFLAGVTWRFFAHPLRRRPGRDPAWLAVPPRLSEGPDSHLLRPRARPARRRLSHPAKQDRLRLGRGVRQGVSRRQPEPSELPAGKNRPISSSPCWPRNGA